MIQSSEDIPKIVIWKIGYPGYKEYTFGRRVIIAYPLMPDISAAPFLISRNVSIQVLEIPYRVTSVERIPGEDLWEVRLTKEGS